MLGMSSCREVQELFMKLLLLGFFPITYIIAYRFLEINLDPPGPLHHSDLKIHWNWVSGGFTDLFLELLTANCSPISVF